MTGLPVTEPQTRYVRAMQRKLHLTNALLDAHCVARWKRPFAELNRAECSALIDEMAGWVDVPAQLQREAGQRVIPGIEL